jgi:hypothetical protein
MDIYSEVGSKIKYIGDVTDEQVKYFNNTDPRGLLVEGEIYTIKEIDVRSWHTNVYIEEHEGRFNSVFFENVKEE